MRFIIIFFCVALQIAVFAQNMGVKLPASTLPNTTLDVNGSAAFREGAALNLINGVNNDIALTDFSFFRITGPTAAFSITGFAGGQNGRVLTLINATSFILTFTHQATSGATNQINTGGSSLNLAANGVATFVYNSFLSKWVVSGGVGFTTDWSINGNSGTTAGTNFIGTTDAQPLVFKANNSEGLRLLTSGNVGIGTQTPQSKLDVEGGVVIGATYSGTNAAPTNGLLVEGNVGIGINPPTNKLHVSTATNPLRLEGLQSSSSTDSMLTVNSTGVVRRTNAPAYVDIVDLKGTASITAGAMTATGGASTLGVTTQLVYSTTFTLARTSLILIDASTTGKRFQTSSSSPITDGAPRFFRSYWSLSGSTDRYGASSSFYTNSASDVTSVSGTLSNNNSCNMILAAGTHTLELYLTVICSSGRSVRMEYGNDINERISIKAIQLQ
jgi:hypothetical protein